MTGLPKIGERIKVWPMPGLKVQASALPFDDGGMRLPDDGREVTWSEHTYRQLLHGEILLHDPQPTPGQEQ